MDLREIGIDGAIWIRLSQDRVQWWGFVPSVSIKKAEFFDKLTDNQLSKYSAPWNKYVSKKVSK
jgi:hypothetical protein